MRQSRLWRALPGTREVIEDSLSLLTEVVRFVSEAVDEGVQFSLGILQRCAFPIGAKRLFDCHAWFQGAPIGVMIELGIEATVLPAPAVRIAALFRNSLKCLQNRTIPSIDI